MRGRDRGGRGASICGGPARRAGEHRPIPARLTRCVRPILERGGLRVGRDFHLARSRPSARIRTTCSFTTRTIPQAGRRRSRPSAGGGRGRCTAPSSTASCPGLQRQRRRGSQAAREHLPQRQHRARSTSSRCCSSAWGSNVWEIIDAAATKPFGFTPFLPRARAGRHIAFPSTHSISPGGRASSGSPTRFIELAGEVNLAMPAYVIERLADAPQRARGVALKGARSLDPRRVAYKRDLDDDRESPAYKLMELLRAKQAQFELPRSASCPALATVAPLRTFSSASVPLDCRERRAAADAVLIATDHSQYRLRLRRPA